MWQSVPLQCDSIAPAPRPVICPGRYGAPAGARGPHGLLENGLPRSLRGLAMTRGSLCSLTEVPRFRQMPGRVMTLPYGQARRHICRGGS